MVYATIVKEFIFDAAHQLQGHHGLCKNVHGHTYKLQVGVYGAVKDEPGTTDEGMVIDCEELEKIVKA